jgi:hypothetical protein
MPRWLLPLLALSLAVLAVVATRPIFLPPINLRLTRENGERIKQGMKWADVEAILGPPGDYRTGPTDDDLEADAVAIGFHPPCLLLGETTEAWSGDSVHIRIWGDVRGAVTGVRFYPVDPQPVGMLELLRWRWNHWWESRR